MHFATVYIVCKLPCNVNTQILELVRSSRLNNVIMIALKGKYKMIFKQNK